MSNPTLEDFYKWCISESSSPMDRKHIAWEQVELFREFYATQIMKWDFCKNGALKAPAQPVSKPKPVGYFSYGSERGFSWHETEQEAIESAKAAIDDYRGDACGGWDEETDSICCGVIMQKATMVDERPRTEDDTHLDPHVDTVCDYALLPVQESE